MSRWFDRLRRSGEIAYVRRAGRRANARTVALYLVERSAGPPRVTVTASTAVGGAVRRNAVKRRVRGALDALGPVLPPHASLVVVARAGSAEAAYADLARDLAGAIAAVTRQ